MDFLNKLIWWLCSLLIKVHLVSQQLLAPDMYYDSQQDVDLHYLQLRHGQCDQASKSINPNT